MTPISDVLISTISTVTAAVDLLRISNTQGLDALRGDVRDLRDDLGTLAGRVGSMEISIAEERGRRSADQTQTSNNLVTWKDILTNNTFVVCAAIVVIALSLALGGPGLIQAGQGMQRTSPVEVK